MTRAKAAREAELKNCIWKLRCESMVIDEEIKRVKSGGKGVRGVDSTSSAVSPTLQHVPASPNSPISSSDYATSNPLLMVPLTPDITASDSFQAELNKTRIEYERLNREIEGLKVLIEGAYVEPAHD